MRRFLIPLLLCCLAALKQEAVAQGNLQFNRVVFMEMSVAQTSTTVYSETSQSITVPANKVWKIESASGTSLVPSSLQTGAGAGYMLINGEVISLGSNGSWLPVWLPAGTYTLTLRSSIQNTAFTFSGFISVIEFNIVP